MNYPHWLHSQKNIHSKNDEIGQTTTENEGYIIHTQRKTLETKQDNKLDNIRGNQKPWQLVQRKDELTQRLNRKQYKSNKITTQTQKRFAIIYHKRHTLECKRCCSLFYGGVMNASHLDSLQFCLQSQLLHGSPGLKNVITAVYVHRCCSTLDLHPGKYIYLTLSITYNLWIYEWIILSGGW